MLNRLFRKPPKEGDFYRVYGDLRISEKAMQEVLDAFLEYKQQVEGSTLEPSTQETYLRYAGFFVRWLCRDYEPRSR